MDLGIEASRKREKCKKTTKKKGNGAKLDQCRKAKGSSKSAG